MRLNCLKVPAYLVPEDTFIYLPKKKMFFFVDFIDYCDDDKISFIHESDFTEKGFIINELIFKKDELVICVGDYNCTMETLIEEIEEKEKQSELDEELDEEFEDAI
jgi:hypothetical protein